MSTWAFVPFRDFLRPNRRPYVLGPVEDANLVGMRWYGEGPFHRELKPALRIRKKNHFQIRTGDVIYNKLFAWKGTFGIVPSELDGMFVSDKFPTYKLNKSQVEPDYLRWYFKYSLLWEQARQMSKGSAALSKLTLNPPQFLDLTVPLPPRLSEQRRIVTKIKKLAVKVSQTRDLRTGASQQSHAILKACLNAIAEEFSGVQNLGNVLTEKPRNGWSARCDNVEGGTPVLALGAVTGYEYDSTAYKRTALATDPSAHYWLQRGDLLITRSNTPELVGHAAIYSGKPKPCIYPDLVMRLQVNDKCAHKRFLWYWLQSPIVRRFITANAKGTSPTMRKISQSTVMRIPFPKGVGLSEQASIVAYLDGLQEKSGQLKVFQAQTAAKLDALLPSILDKAFTGELL